MASFQSSQCPSAMMVADPSISSIVMNEFGLYYLLPQHAVKIQDKLDPSEQLP